MAFIISWIFLSGVVGVRSKVDIIVNNFTVKPVGDEHPINNNT